MKEETDPLTGQTWIQLSKDEIKIGFMSQCIEAVAAAENCDYVDMFHRMERANLTEGYIMAHYEALHTESMENIVDELRDLLHKRESEPTVTCSKL